MLLLKLILGRLTFFLIPVILSFSQVRADFFHYDRGVYSYSSEPERGQLNGDYTLAGYHSVKLIGWGVENGEEYWVKIYPAEIYN